jgi:hypothetical protein
MTTVQDKFQYKDLVIGFTTNFECRWHDMGSGGKYNGAFWHPIIPPDMADFHPIGTLGWPGYGDINGMAVIAVVKDANGDKGDALRKPTKYELVWNDKGSGAKYNGSMWRPIPPEGYVALGLVCNKDWGPPPPEDVRCVRSDLVVSAMPGDCIWVDTETGSDTDFGAWGIWAPGAPAAGEILFSPGTFIGWTSHLKPTTDPNAYALLLPIQQETPPDNSTPPAPILHDYSRPTPYEQDTVAYSSILPWFTVKDPNLTPAAQLVKSPKYRLERKDHYKLIDHGYNDTSETQEFNWSFTTGTSEEKAKTFSETTSIELGGEWQISGTFKFSAKLNQSFTYTETTTEGWSTAVTKQITVKVPPGKAVAAYSIQSTYRLFRADGSQVSTEVPYNTESIYWTEYPRARKSQVKVKMIH